MEGTSLVRVREALEETLSGFDINFLAQSPTQTSEIAGPDGTGRACWFDDDNIAATLEADEMLGGVLWIDEVVTIPIKLQALGAPSETQAQVDAAVSDMLGRLLAVVAADPTLSIADDDQIQTYHVLPVGWTYDTGVIGEGPQRAGGLTLTLAATARLKLEAYG